MTRSSKQDHNYLCLHDISKKYFLIFINEFQLLETNNLTTQTNYYFLRINNNVQQIKYYTSRTFDYNEKLISRTNQSKSRNSLIYKSEQIIWCCE